MTQPEYLTELQDSVEGIEPSTLFREVVPGRWLNADGDSLAYHCSGNDSSVLSYLKRMVRDNIVFRSRMAGAEYCRLHMTGGDHSKGGRYLIAVTQPYQSNRVGQPKPKHLYEIRDYILSLDGTDIDGIPVEVIETSEEADDTITQANQSMVDAGTPELSVAHFDDKDMTMMNGLCMDWTTFDITECYGYGWLELKELESSKKLVGRGKAFFFAQCLMGDPTDSIPGLPYFVPKITHKYWPCKQLQEQLRRTIELTMPSGKRMTYKQIESTRDKIKSLVSNSREKSCGPVSVMQYLGACDNEKAALHAVLRAYRAYYGTRPDTVEITDTYSEEWDYMHFFLEQARLLWMRRYPNEDVTSYIEEVLDATLPEKYKTLTYCEEVRKAQDD